MCVSSTHTHCIFDSIIIWISCSIQWIYFDIVDTYRFEYRRKTTKKNETDEEKKQRFVRQRLNLIASWKTKINKWKTKVASACSFSIDCCSHLFSSLPFFSRNVVTQSKIIILLNMPLGFFDYFVGGKVCQIFFLLKSE